MVDTSSLAEIAVVSLGLLGGAAVVALTYLGYRRTGQKAMAWLSAGFVLLTAGLFVEHLYMKVFRQPHPGMPLAHLPGVIGFLLVLVSAWKSRGPPARREAADPAGPRAAPPPAAR